MWEEASLPFKAGRRGQSSRVYAHKQGSCLREWRILTHHSSFRLIHLEAKPLEDPMYNALEPKLSDARNVVYIARATVENAQAGYLGRLGCVIGKSRSITSVT